jgi:hypothetical protein
MHPAARTALDCLDLAGEIVGFIDLHALLPVLLSDHRLRDAVRRILGPVRSLTSDQNFFVTSVPLMQWAISMGCRTEGLCKSAALSGSMDVLKWLRNEIDPPCPWNADTCHAAAEGGHLHVLKWLREENDPPCPWNSSTCAFDLRLNLHRLKLICGVKAFKIMKLELKLTKIETALEVSTDRLAECELEIGLLKREKIFERNLMLIRQLATSYQYRSAKYVDVGSVDRRYCTTHSQLMDSALKFGLFKKTRADAIESEFLKFRPTLTSTVYISNVIKQVRELGTSTSLPSLKINDDLTESAPTVADMRTIIAETFAEGLITNDEREDALTVLSAIIFISPLVGITDVLQSAD